MENTLFELIVSQGIFAVLFLYLLFYVLKENKIREQKYQGIILEFSGTLNKIEKDLEKIIKI